MSDILEGRTGCKHHHPFFEEECRWCVMADIHEKRKQYMEVQEHNKKIEKKDNE